MPKPILRLILGDQLNISHSWLAESSAPAEYLIMEVREEATYARHHVQKIVAFFLAMRSFAEELRARGLIVHYISLDDPENQHSFAKNVSRLIASGRFSAFEYQQPDEYRVEQDLLQLASSLPVPSRAADSEHFLVSRQFFQDVFRGHKRYVMESFYREVRRRHRILLDGDKPAGGRWNFDAENRKKLPDSATPPVALRFPRDVRQLVSMLGAKGVPSIGSIDPSNFGWPVTREESLAVLSDFCERFLPSFGSYQDAMHTDHRLLFHSKLSFSMNVKLISPMEVIESAIGAWERSKGKISIAQIEGFVRQIAGWREFMRGVYWAHMPSYKTLNFFGANRPLPHYFWDGETKMRCVKHAVDQSLEDAYAHHIQRLMVTGNFLLLSGVSPDDVDAWYLGVYADAIEWVQLPNTRGMSQFADGGIVGTKPYMSSANYINKMSNYCSGCSYKLKERTGPGACPFNSLYWNFLISHREKLQGNPRIGMGYKLIDKMSSSEVAEITAQAQHYLNHLEEL